MAAALFVTACTAATDDVAGDTAGDTADVTAEPTPAAAPSPPAAAGPTATPTASPTPTPAPAPAVDVSAMRAVVDTLAGEIGPREGTSDSFAQAADLVEQTLADLGYDVTRQPVPVPAGNSWGVPVPAGESENVVAVPAGADLTQPHLVVGAHLDTVPQAPGGVDNASGISVVLEVARLSTLAPPEVPVVFVAFGAEEPRGPGDDLHHFGSQAYVAAMPAPQREALVGAVAIDSVGVSSSGVPICSATGTDPFTDAVRERAQAAGAPVRACENRTSDHWSFVRNGLHGTRIGLAGQTEFAEYHSPADQPDVVSDDLLAEAADAVWGAVSASW